MTQSLVVGDVAAAEMPARSSSVNNNYSHHLMQLHPILGDFLMRQA